MQIRTILKPILPHIVAVAIFLFISLVYFYPALEGKVLHTNDGTVAQNAAKEISDFRAKYGEEPLWTNSMFSGMPAYLISTEYSGNLMTYADRILKFVKLTCSFDISYNGRFLYFAAFLQSRYTTGHCRSYCLRPFDIFFLYPGGRT